MQEINVGIVDDHKLVAQGFEFLINSIDGINVALVKHDAKSFFRTLCNSGTKIDIALVDLSLENVSGIELTANIKKALPQIKVIIISMHAEPHMIREAVKAGAVGFISKSTDQTELGQAILSVYKNNYYFNDLISQKIITQAIKGNQIIPTFRNDHNLSAREIEVIKLMCKELTRNEIADKLELSPRTVETHITNAINKIGAIRMNGLIVYGTKQGWDK